MRKTYAILIGIAPLVLSLAISFEPTGIVKAFSQPQTPLHPSTNPPAAEQETKDWIEYKWGGMSFKYPRDWQVTPQYYRTPPQEAAGEPASILGLTISPKGDPASRDRSINIGGRTTCDSVPSCKCFTIYDAEYICGTDTESAKIFDLFIRTIRNDDSNSAFAIVFPTAQDTLHPSTRYTIRWTTKSRLRIPKVHIMVYDTSRFWREGVVLDAKEFTNTGRYDWIVPGSIPSPGPYLLGISFVKPIRATPPALSSGRIYQGRSNPFYIY